MTHGHQIKRTPLSMTINQFARRQRTKWKRLAEFMAWRGEKAGWGQIKSGGISIREIEGGVDIPP
jgi:hypothetical protein